MRNHITQYEPYGVIWNYTVQYETIRCTVKSKNEYDFIVRNMKP